MDTQPLDKTDKITLAACGFALAMILASAMALAMEYGLL